MFWELPRYRTVRSSQPAMGSGATLVSRKKKGGISLRPLASTRSAYRAPAVRFREGTPCAVIHVRSCRITANRLYSPTINRTFSAYNQKRTIFDTWRYDKKYISIESSQTQLAKYYKYIRYTLSFIMILLILALLLLQLPAVQTYVVHKVNNSLSEKLGNKIKVSSVDINFFNNVDLNKIYIEDQSQDTLAFIEELNISVSLIGLLKKELLIKKVDLFDAFIHLKKDTKTERFNYQFIIDAFASTDTLAEKSDKSPIYIDIDQVWLSNTHFILEDDATKSYVDFQLDEGGIEITTFDLDNNKFELDELSLNKAVVDVQYNPDPSAVRDELIFPKLPLTLILKDLSLSDSKIAISAKNSKPTKGTLAFDNLVLTNLQLEGQDINLDSTQISGTIKKMQTKDHSGFAMTDFKSYFAVDNQKIEISDFELSTLNSKITNNTLLNFTDFADLQKIEKLELITSFDDTQISIADIKYFANLKSQKIFKNITASEKVLLNGKASGDSKYLEFSKLSANIPGVIGINVNGYVKNILEKDRLAFDVNIKELKTSSSKLSKVLPTNTLPSGLDNFGDISLQGGFNGNLKSFEVSKMNLGTSAKTSAQLSGTITNVLDPNQLLLNVNIKEVKTHLDDIRAFFKGDLPPAIRDAGAMAYTGEFKGTLQDFTLDGNLRTDIGDAQTDVAIHFNSDYTDAKYNGALSLDNFNLGSILNNKDFGKVSLKLKTEGSGFDFDNIDNTLNAKVSSLIYKDVDYQNFEFNGSVAQKVINGDFNIDNPNAQATFKGMLDLSTAQPNMNFELAVDTLSLKPMNLTKQDVAFSGVSKVVGKGKSLDAFIGSIQIINLNLRKDSLSYHSDSLVCTSILNSSAEKQIKFNTDRVIADITGDFTLSQLPVYINNVVDEYIPVAWFAEQKDETGKTLDDPQIFKAFLNIEDESLVKLFVPKLDEMEKLELKARVNSETDSLSINGSIKTISYDDIISSNITLNTVSQDNKILNKINFKDLSGLANLQLPNTTIDANLQKDSLLLILDTKGYTNNNLLNLGATLSKSEDLYEVNFRNQLALDTAQWDIASDNYIKFKENYLDIQSFSISKGRQILDIRSQSNEAMGSSSIEINIDKFNVHELSNLFALENDAIYGTANGQIILDNIFKDVNYTGDLIIKDIIIDTKKMGDFKVDAARRESAQIIDINVSLIGAKNDFRGNGYIDLETNKLKFESDFKQLELAVLDPFLVGIISQSQGTFGGKANISGSLDKPIINGTIQTNKLSTLIDFSKSRYAIHDQTFKIDNSEISFDNIALKDVNGNTAVVNGEITHNNFTDFTYQLSVESNTFQYLNTTAKDNPLFYGTLNLDLNAKVTGPLNLPNLDVNAKALAGSIFHLSPFIESDVISQDDYIIFINKEITAADTSTVELYELKNSLPLNLTLDLEVDPKTEFQFIIDPVSGDRLSSFGNASLQVSVPPSGNIEVFGDYIIDNGKYSFTYAKLLKRDFDLVKGGRVTFQGNPLLAQFNVNAAYNTKASPFPLLTNSSATESEVSEARQRTAVQIMLNLSGSISDLLLKFGLNFPDNDFNSATAVGRRIADIESDQEALYNQVFSLLLLNSFFSAESSGGNLGNAAPNAALRSVSGLIEDRLNKLADNLIKGFEVNINLDSYNSSSLNSDRGNTSVTEFGLGISKRLFNDRLTIQAIGNLNVDNSSNSAAASGLAGDFIIEYKLNEKGNYSVSAFRKSDFNILEDESSNKNGVGIQYRKSLRLRKLKKVADEK